MSEDGVCGALCRTMSAIDVSFLLIMGISIILHQLDRSDGHIGKGRNGGNTHLLSYIHQLTPVIQYIHPCFITASKRNTEHDLKQIIHCWIFSVTAFLNPMNTPATSSLRRWPLRLRRRLPAIRHCGLCPAGSLRYLHVDYPQHHVKPADQVTLLGDKSYLDCAAQNGSDSDDRHISGSRPTPNLIGYSRFLAPRPVVHLLVQSKLVASPTSVKANDDTDVESRPRRLPPSLSDLLTPQVQQLSDRLKAQLASARKDRSRSKTPKTVEPRIQAEIQAKGKEILDTFDAWIRKTRIQAKFREERRKRRRLDKLGLEKGLDEQGTEKSYWTKESRDDNEIGM